MCGAGTVRVLAASFDCALNPGTTPHTISAAVAPKSASYPESLAPAFPPLLFSPTHAHTAIPRRLQHKKRWVGRWEGRGGGGGGGREEEEEEEKEEKEEERERQRERGTNDTISRL